MHILKLSNVNDGGTGPLYKSTPALSADEHQPTKVPTARAGHTATVINGKIFVYGGYSEHASKAPADDASYFCAWVFDPIMFHWSYIENQHADMTPRHDHSSVAYGHDLIIHGGYDKHKQVLSDTWRLSTNDPKTSTQLPSINNSELAQTAHMPTYVAAVDTKLYVLHLKSNLSTSLYTIDIAHFKEEPKSTKWDTVDIPTNPLTPGPKPRQGTTVLPITTGQGRHYLLLMLGQNADDGANEEDMGGGPGPAIEHNDPTQPSIESLSISDSEGATHQPLKISPDAPKPAQKFKFDIWTLQLPSPDSTSAKAKDATRENLGFESGAMQWSEVELITGEEGAEASNSTMLGNLGETAANAVKTIGESAGGIYQKLWSVGSSQGPQETKEPGAEESASGKNVVQHQAKEHPAVASAKSHPGPRAYFGAAALDGSRILLWGGVSAKEEWEGDGWVIDLRI